MSHSLPQSHIYTRRRTRNPRDLRALTRTHILTHPSSQNVRTRARARPCQRAPPKAPLLRVGPIFWTRWKAQTPSSSCTYKKPSVAEQANPVALSSHSTCGTVVLASGHAWTRGGGGGRCIANAPCRGTRRSWACDPGSPLAKPAANKQSMWVHARRRGLQAARGHRRFCPHALGASNSMPVRWTTLTEQSPQHATRWPESEVFMAEMSCKYSLKTCTPTAEAHPPSVTVQ